MYRTLPHDPVDDVDDMWHVLSINLRDDLVSDKTVVHSEEGALTWHKGTVLDGENRERVLMVCGTTKKLNEDCRFATGMRGDMGREIPNPRCRRRARSPMIDEVSQSTPKTFFLAVDCFFNANHLHNLFPCCHGSCVARASARERTTSRGHGRDVGDRCPPS